MGGDCGAVGVVRSLGRAGIPTVFLQGKNPLAGYSRYTARCRFFKPIAFATFTIDDLKPCLVDLPMSLRRWFAKNIEIDASPNGPLTCST